MLFKSQCTVNDNDSKYALLHLKLLSDGHLYSQAQKIPAQAMCHLFRHVFYLYSFTTSLIEPFDNISTKLFVCVGGDTFFFLLTASIGEPGQSKMKGWPIAFHDVHSDNIQLSSDRRRAKRIETFCKGICFSGRPIMPNEHVYIRFSEVSTSWSGAVRFGFMSHDPASLDKSALPRYACPDLTNVPGYWAKALPERLARHGSVLLYYVTPGGDVMFGINGEDKGVFFSGINTRGPLWALIDIYGNTVAIEFVGKCAATLYFMMYHLQELELFIVFLKCRADVKMKILT
jgi:hypothetical protein